MYELKVNKKQLEIINEALHMLMRAETGQYSYALDKYIRSDEVASVITSDQAAWLQEAGDSYEINSMHGKTEVGDIAYDLHQVIRHQLWREQPDAFPLSIAGAVTHLYAPIPLGKLKKLDDE